MLSTLDMNDTFLFMYHIYSKQVNGFQCCFPINCLRNFVNIRKFKSLVSITNNKV